MPNKVGNISTEATPIRQPKMPDRDSIGRGTTDLVPGRTTRLSETLDEVKVDRGKGNKIG